MKEDTYHKAFKKYSDISLFIMTLWIQCAYPVTSTLLFKVQDITVPPTNHLNYMCFYLQWLYLVHLYITSVVLQIIFHASQL